VSAAPDSVGIVFVDGHTLATAASDRQLTLWDRASGARLASIDAGCPLRSIAATRDGALLAASCEVGAIELFDARTLARRPRLEGHRGHVWRIGFSPDGTRLVSVAADRTVRVWDIAQAIRWRRSRRHLRACRRLAPARSRRR
jgi:WD40 repeat protein